MGSLKMPLSSVSDNPLHRSASSSTIQRRPEFLDALADVFGEDSVFALQQLGLSVVGVDDFELQQDLFVWFVQHALATDFSGSGALAMNQSGGFTPFFLAQASFCWSLKQQQDRQHCSADEQPQAQCWQG
jgi:hypothetical protein